MKKGFTLIEMLVVVGIIAVLIAASLGAYSKVTGMAEKTRGQELVNNVATALTALYQKEGSWPKALRDNGATDGELNERAAYPLAKGGYLSLTVENGHLSGFDKFGIVTPWGLTHIKHLGNKAQLDDVVGKGRLRDHILHYALDLDGDGIIEGASIGGESVDVRATAIVWCCGKDGRISPYTKGLRGDDIYSFSKGQTRNVK